MKRSACILKAGLVSLTIRETLAGHLLDGNGRTFRIVEAKLNAMVIAEMETLMSKVMPRYCICPHIRNRWAATSQADQTLRSMIADIAQSARAV
jgi:hypothetical protein